MNFLSKGKMHASNIIRRTLVIFLIFACMAGISSFIPPFHSPDENAHLLRADMIAHGQWILQPEDAGGGREGGYVDPSWQNFSLVMLTIAGAGKDKTSAKELAARGDQIRWSGEKIFEKSQGTGYYFPIIYTPHALGLFVSRQLNLTMSSSYALTRAMVLMTSAALVAWALALYTPNVLTLMLVITPMALFQLSSPTIDGLCTGMALVVVGLWFRISFATHQANIDKISKQELCLYGLIFVLCTTRTNLLPLLLIPSVLLVSKYSRQRLFAVVLLYALTLGWIAFGVLSTYDDRIVRQHSTLEILTKYLSNPEEFFDLLHRTVSNVYVRKFYRDSFFGILGWVDTPIPRQAIRVLVAAVGIAAIVITVRTRWFQAVLTRSAFFLIGGVSIVLIFFAMAITWTTYPAQFIAGVQGRYFLIPLIFMSAALGPILAEPRKYSHIEIAAISAFLFYSILILITTLSIQYRMIDIY